MKRSLVKKAVALGLSFCIPMGLTTSTFASGDNDLAGIEKPQQVISGIKYYFNYKNMTYFVSGLNREELKKEDFSFESLLRTHVTMGSSGFFNIHNPCCGIKVVFAIAALHSIGYGFGSTIRFIKRLGPDCSVNELRAEVLNLIRKNLNHRRASLAFQIAEEI